MTRPRTRSFSLSGANKKSTKPSVRYIHDIQSLKPCSALQCSRAHHPPYATHTHTHTHTNGVCDEPLPTHFLLLLCMYRGCHWGSGTLSVVRTRASEPRLCRRCPELSGQVQRSLHGRDLPGAFTVSISLLGHLSCSVHSSAVVIRAVPSSFRLT